MTAKLICPRCRTEFEQETNAQKYCTKYCSKSSKYDRQANSTQSAKLQNLINDDDAMDAKLREFGL